MESLVYAQKLSDLEPFDLTNSKVGEMFYRCFDMRGFRFIYHKRIVRRTPCYVYLESRLIKTMNVCDSKEWSKYMYRIKISTIQKDCYKNFK
jgi:hypothetical protein